MIRLHLNLIRLRCVRRGHALLCTSLGHVCTRCGSSWEQLP